MSSGQDRQDQIVPCSRCGKVEVLNPHPLADLVTCEECSATTVLEIAAERIEAELICCDVYERLVAKGEERWTEEDRKEKRTHAICYWSNAARHLVLGLRAGSAAPSGG